MRKILVVCTMGTWYEENTVSFEFEKGEFHFYREKPDFWNLTHGFFRLENIKYIIDLTNMKMLYQYKGSE